VKIRCSEIKLHYHASLIEMQMHLTPIWQGGHAILVFFVQRFVVAAQVKKFGAHAYSRYS
jgi:hypothetical protein